mmetsp:Transcript_43829/g.140811  ORF Transcript_43829/g.140811 Transcript_43829/m.140811 type:complete len:276 (-) Transcript_43829:701-1528(-)
MGAPVAPYESRICRSSVRDMVMSFLCGNFVFALKSTLSLLFFLPSPSSSSPLSSLSASASLSPSTPSLTLIACGKASTMLKSRSRKEVESFAAYSVAPSAPASSALIEAEVGLPKKSLAASLTRATRVAPPMSSILCTSSLVMFAWSRTDCSAGSRRGKRPSQRASMSAREMTRRRSRSSWTASMATLNSLLAERTSLTRSASLRSLPIARADFVIGGETDGYCLVNSWARMSRTAWSKRRPPSDESEATPRTAIEPVVLFFLPTAVEKETRETW